MAALSGESGMKQDEYASVQSVGGEAGETLKSGLLLGILYMSQYTQKGSNSRPCTGVPPWPTQPRSRCQKSALRLCPLPDLA